MCQQDQEVGKGWGCGRGKEPFIIPWGSLCSDTPRVKPVPSYTGCPMAMALVALEVEGPGAGVALLLWAQGSETPRGWWLWCWRWGQWGCPHCWLEPWHHEEEPHRAGSPWDVPGDLRQFPARRVMH